MVIPCNTDTLQLGNMDNVSRDSSQRLHLSHALIMLLSLSHDGIEYQQVHHYTSLAVALLLMRDASSNLYITCCPKSYTWCAVCLSSPVQSSLAKWSSLLVIAPEGHCLPVPSCIKWRKSLFSQSLGTSVLLPTIVSCKALHKSLSTEDPPGQNLWVPNCQTKSEQQSETKSCMI